MKKLIKLLLPGLLAFTAIIVSVHVHDEDCGYDPVTETGCIYEAEINILKPGEDDPRN